MEPKKNGLEGSGAPKSTSDFDVKSPINNKGESAAALTMDTELTTGGGNEQKEEGAANGKERFTAQPPSAPQIMSEAWMQQLTAALKENRELIAKNRDLEKIRTDLCENRMALFEESMALSSRKFKLQNALEDVNAEMIELLYDVIVPATAIKFAERKQLGCPALHWKRIEHWAGVYGSDEFKEYQATANQAPALKALLPAAGTTAGAEEGSSRVALEFGRIVHAIQERTPQLRSYAGRRRVTILPVPLFSLDEQAVMRAVCDFIPVPYAEEMP